MTKRERDQHRDLPARAALEASLPDDPNKLRKLVAQLVLDKAVLEQELSIVKNASVTVGDLTNRQNTQIVDALRPSLPLPVLLATVGLSSSSFYYQRHAMTGPDKYASLRKHIAATAKASHSTYGNRRNWWSMRHAGLTVSEKVVRRLMAEDHIPVMAPGTSGNGPATKENSPRATQSSPTQLPCRSPMSVVVDRYHRVLGC